VPVKLGFARGQRGAAEQDHKLRAMSMKDCYAQQPALLLRTLSLEPKPRDATSAKDTKNNGSTDGHMYEERPNSLHKPNHVRSASGPDRRSTKDKPEERAIPIDKLKTQNKTCLALPPKINRPS
jgi:hypothetical protein